MVWQTSEFGRHGHGGWSMHCSLRAISSINSYADFQTSHQGVKLRMELSAWKRPWATPTPKLLKLRIQNFESWHRIFCLETPPNTRSHTVVLNGKKGLCTEGHTNSKSSANHHEQ